jgi:hypothetical protein
VLKKEAEGAKPTPEVPVAKSTEHKEPPTDTHRAEAHTNRQKFRTGEPAPNEVPEDVLRSILDDTNET